MAKNIAHNKELNRVKKLEKKSKEKAKALRQAKKEKKLNDSKVI